MIEVSIAVSIFLSSLVFAIPNIGRSREIERAARKLPRAALGLISTAISETSELLNCTKDILPDIPPTVFYSDILSIIDESFSVLRSSGASIHEMSETVLETTQALANSTIGDVSKVMDTSERFIEPVKDILDIPGKVPVEAIRGFTGAVSFSGLSSFGSIMKGVELIPNIDISFDFPLSIPIPKIPTDFILDTVMIPFQATAKVNHVLAKAIASPVRLLEALKNAIPSDLASTVTNLIEESEIITNATELMENSMDGTISNLRHFKFPSFTSTVPIYDIRGYGGYGGFANVQDHMTNNFLEALAKGFIGPPPAMPGALISLLSQIGGSIPGIPAVPASLPYFTGFPGVNLSTI